mmetsp:Transcript_41173/g.96581  ORF Transcript_41173/g.96581 Transcript_41173/m.96581 type:complete len:276 (-) Transcript_41173:99-926(-)
MPVEEGKATEPTEQCWASLAPLFEEHLVDHASDSLVLDLGGRRVSVLQDRSLLSAGDATQLGSLTESTRTTGAVAWDGGVVLARFLLSRGWAANARVVELGAGCGGLPTLAALFGGAARCTATDRSLLLPGLRANLRRNLRAEEVRRVEVAERLWGEVLPEGEVGAAEVVLAADCVYDAEMVEPLLLTMHASCAPEGVALCAWDGSVGRRRSYALLRGRIGGYFEKVEEVPFAGRLGAEDGEDGEAVTVLVARRPRTSGSIAWDAGSQEKDATQS